MTLSLTLNILYETIEFEQLAKNVPGPWSPSNANEYLVELIKVAAPGHIRVVGFTQDFESSFG